MFTEKLTEILGERKQLVILKGQLLYPAQFTKQESGELYATFTLKEPKNFTGDMYGQSFNTYYCVIPAEVYTDIGADKLKELKGNEVTCMIEISNYTKRLRSQQNPEGYIVNNVSYYVYQLELSQELEKTKSLKSKRMVI